MSSFPRALAVLILLCLPVLPVRPALAEAPTRIAGATRLETAAAVATTTRAHADTGVLARADTYGDALAAAPLAAALGGPVLLTDTAGLSPTTAQTIADLGATQAVLVGELTTRVAEDLTGQGVAVSRIVGTDPWSTWAAVAARVGALTGSPTALLVQGADEDPGRGWPDALAASSWAARTGAPILLTRTRDLPDATARALADLAPTELVVVGGTAAVSEDTAAAAAQAAGTASRRVAGPDRYATAVAVAQQADPDPSRVWVASGRSWPDALVAGPAVAATDGVLVLTDPQTLASSPATAAYLLDRPTPLTIVGGVAAVSTRTADELQAATEGRLPGTDSAIPGLDRIPEPAPLPPTPSVQDARPWSDPATWGGTLPSPGDVVTIPADRAVLLDVQPPTLQGIDVQGTLTVADVPMTITVGWITVGGHLAIGTPAAPLTADVTVVMSPQTGHTGHTGQGAITGMGLIDIHGTPPAVTWTELAEIAPQGASVLRVRAAAGWAVGDEVVVSATDPDVDQAERRRLVAVDGTTLTLDRPLDHTHWGLAETVAGVEVAHRAQVANLTRNVHLTSSAAAAADRHGGHLMVMHGRLRMSGAELSHMGQAGVLARYPVHFHMMGSAAGSYVRDTSIHDTFNRCLTIHGTHHVVVRDVVGVESNGHCFFFEDGVESDNVLHRYLAVSTRVPPQSERLIESDERPAGFWVTNPTNHLSDNVSAGSEGIGFWYDLPEAPTGLSAGTELDVRRLPMGSFVRNTAHTSTGEGWENGIGVFVEDYHPPTAAVLADNHSWGNAGFGVWTEGADVVRGTISANQIGFLGQRAALSGTTVVGRTASGVADEMYRLTGVGFYHGASDISDVTFAHFGQRLHAWQRPGLAMEVVTDEMFDRSRVSGARFVDATPIRIGNHGDDDGPRAGIVLDADGSVSGAPAALVPDNNPLLFDPSCTARPAMRAYACPPSYDQTFLRLTDEGGGVMGQVTAHRRGGGSAVLDGPRWDAGASSGDVLLDSTYDLTMTGTHSGHLEVILTGSTPGHVGLAIPWPHPSAHVYDGWGRWTPVATDDPAQPWSLRDGVLTVRHALDDIEEDGTWQRLELCALRHCGNDGPG